MFYQVVSMFLLLEVMVQAHQDTVFDHKDAAHIKQDIKAQFYVELDEKQANERELEFLNFQHYDYDGNLMLDGLEILYELNHDAKHVDDQRNRMSHEERRAYWNDKYHKDADLVDMVVKQYDTNDDGFISFTEYMYLKDQLKQK